MPSNVRRLFWLLSDLLYAVTFGRIDLDRRLTVKPSLVTVLREQTGPGQVTRWYEWKDVTDGE